MPDSPGLILRRHPHLDAKARERQYDVIQTAIAYRGDPNPQFSAKGEALFAWRSVWTYSTAELVKVLAGERERQCHVANFDTGKKTVEITTKRSGGFDEPAR
ncbi:hypothetical protein [Sinorhizobium medicae]|uniref:hypothetical protein n=1 Tax=Sinorhizobium medicae TaxID=110321 RepID=UPI00358DC461